MRWDTGNKEHCSHNMLFCKHRMALQTTTTTATAPNDNYEKTFFLINVPLTPDIMTKSSSRNTEIK